MSSAAFSYESTGGSDRVKSPKVREAPLAFTITIGISRKAVGSKNENLQLQAASSSWLELVFLFLVIVKLGARVTSAREKERYPERLGCLHGRSGMVGTL